MNKRDIKGESIFDKDSLRERIKDLSRENLEPVYIEPKINPKGFFQKAKATILDRILPFIRQFTSFEFYLNVNEFVNGEDDNLILDFTVYIAGRAVIGREVKLI